LKLLECEIYDQRWMRYKVVEEAHKYHEGDTASDPSFMIAVVLYNFFSRKWGGGGVLEAETLTREDQ
jgi:hypothetical protein